MDKLFEDNYNIKNQILSTPKSSQLNIDKNTESFNQQNVNTLDNEDINITDSRPIDSETSLNSIVFDNSEENINKTNCLALTIKEEHKLVAVKNVFLHSLKVTWKVIASAIALHILKIFL